MSERVLISSPSFGTYGGIQAVMLAIASSLDPERFEPVLCFRLVNDSLVAPSFREVLDGESFEYHFVQRRRDLLRLIRSTSLVHHHTPSLDVAAATRLLGRPLVITVHNHRADKQLVRPVMSRAAMRLATRCWVNSQFTAGTWGLDEAQAERMPIASRLPETEIPVASRRGFVFVARWIANKGLEELVEAYAQADLERSEWPLTLVGDGFLRERILERIRQLDLDASVSCPGFVTDAERDRLIASARWLVAPARTQEDLGLTPIEARNVGVPCIVTRDGGLPEAAGEDALICEPGDVEGLRRCLEAAAAMSDDAYAETAARTQRGLRESLRPMSLYQERYEGLLS